MAKWLDKKNSLKALNLLPRLSGALLLLGFMLGSFLPSLQWSVQAAPRQQPILACPDPIIAQWTFTGDTTIPSSGIGTFSAGSGISSPSYYGGPSSSEDPAISYTGWNSANLDINDYIELRVETTGRRAIQLSFDTREFGTGPSSLEIHYSLDGISFTQLGTVSSLWNSSSWHLLDFDFSAEATLEDKTDLYIRLYGYGGSSSSGTWRLDNITISGDCGYSPLEVIINEVAWAGTEASADDEWIELYSPGSGNFDLTGWRLVADDGYPDIVLSGQTSPNGYFLLERARPENVVTGITEIDTVGVSNQIYSGALDDTGEILRLRAPDGSIIDTANGDGGEWSHGRISPASSMERMSTVADSDTNWVTNINQHLTAKDAAGNAIYGTPGEVNWGYSVSYTQTPVPSATPTPASSLALLINEVAWGGTEASTSDEWIELYNPGTYPINLSAGWKLISSDGGLDVDLSGTIDVGSNGYFLLERTNDDPVKDIVADQIYEGSLSNDGEYLQLLAPDGSIVDTANKNGGDWDAGSGSPGFYSMERSGVVEDSAGVWISNTGIVRNGLDDENNPINGTPRQPNWALSVTATPSPIPTRTPIPPTKTPTSFPNQSVVLNEVLARPGHDWNQDGVVDMNDEFIEIINRGTSTVSLSGWKLDDEYNLGSSPYTLPNISLGAGERIAIYGFTSHISLSDGGDTVRLLKSGGTIADVVTYTVIKEPDRSWCRYPEHGFWNSGCFPTPNEENALWGELPRQGADSVRTSCLVPDTAPEEVILIECGLLGMDIYDGEFWEENLPAYWLRGQAKSSTWLR